ncbi:MAG: VOC family protein [Anaerolineales bacterium]|nr:VOC family protein [Anaerolineales bacterium]MCB8950554.1 VOC family protein [Ardenticatenales bacterium]
MTITGIDHAQITIPRGAEAQGRQFYVHLLGLPEVEKPASLQGRGGFWVRLGAQELHVGVEDGVDRWRTKAHVALAVTDLAEWRRRLAEANVTVETSIPIPAADRFEIRDPFGNRLEFIQRHADRGE